MSIDEDGIPDGVVRRPFTEEEKEALDEPKIAIAAADVKNIYAEGIEIGFKLGKATVTPTDQPTDPTGRLLFNAYGRQCYDAGLEAKTDILLRQGELIDELKADLATANAARVKWAEACDHMEDVLEADNAALRERVQELERKLHHESIEHTEAQERIVELEAKLLELKRCDLQT